MIVEPCRDLENWKFVITGFEFFLELLAIFSAFITLMIQAWFQDDGDLLKFLYELLDTL